MHHRLKNAALALSLCLLIVLVGGVASRFLSIASAIPLFVLALLCIAWRFPSYVAVIASVTATLTLDFFFTTPLYTLRVGSSQDLAALVSFLIVVLFVSHLSLRLSERTSRLIAREASQQALYRLAERSLLLDWRTPIEQELCRAVWECFALQGVGLWDAAESRFISAGTMDESALAREAFITAKESDSQSIRQSIRLLHAGPKSIGSIQLQGDLPDPATIGSIVTLVSLALERARALNREVIAQSEKSSEQLRSSVLDGLAHSIKTPLTTISLSSAGAVAIGGLTSTQQKLLKLVEEQAHFIANLTDELLRTARLDTPIVVQRRQLDLSELLRTLAKEVDASGSSARLRLTGIETPLPILTDPVLLRMTLLQITENALKYSQPDSVIAVAVRKHEPHLSIRVHNHGSFIEPHEAKLIFHRFYRSPSVEQRAPGTGLGLSVAQRSIAALGGSIEVESDRTCGTTFTIQLPMGRG